MSTETEYPSAQAVARYVRVSPTKARRVIDLVRGKSVEQALDIEFRELPEVVNLETVREDYGGLLTHYESMIASSKRSKTPAPKEMITKVVKVADRWRSLDPDKLDVPRRAAALLESLGATELAWDYTTTPMGLKPGESEPWLALAQKLRGENRIDEADAVYVQAFKVEPTNADILWERAECLKGVGRTSEARALYRRIAEGEWQPRFASTREQARALR